MSTMFFVMAFAGGDGNRIENIAGENTTSATRTPNQEIPVGEYAFMPVTSIRSDGSENVNTNVHRSLVLNDNGTYQHSIYIGNSLGGCGPGKYQTSGDTLRLIPDSSAGCNAKDWKYIYDSKMNRLSLRDDNVTLLYCVAGKENCFNEN